MTCDEGRPCQRWSAPTPFVLWRFAPTHSFTSIKREIAHLCHDEQKPSVGGKEKGPSTTASTTTSTPTPTPEADPQAQPKPALSAPEQSINAFPCECPAWSRAQCVFIVLHSDFCTVRADARSYSWPDLAIHGDAPGSFVLST